MYVPLRKAAEHFNVSVQTISSWAERGEIDYITLPGGHRRFKLRGEGNVLLKNDGEEGKEKINIVYCRVSSHGQKDDLQRQINHMQQKYPGWRVFTDIGSGLNWKRKGLKTVLRLCMRGDVETVAVAHRDRLVRFGYELIEYILEECGVKLLCDSVDDHKSKETELAEDILSIVTVFSARFHGRRNYEKNQKNNHNTESRGEEEVKAMDGVLQTDL